LVVDIRFRCKRSTDPVELSADVLVIPLLEGDQQAPAMRRLDRALGRTLLAHARDVGFRGQEGKGLMHRAASGGGFKAVYLAGLG